ncbi:MAG: hypothetical protein ACTSXD_07165 [Candidatus Heimdallarchaeaceae archaeon]
MDIKNLIADGEKISYKGTEFQIQPLTVREQAKFAQLQGKEQFQEASEFLFVTTLQKTTDWSEEEILKINDKEFINLVTSKIMEVNGMETKKKPVLETSEKQ